MNLKNRHLDRRSVKKKHCAFSAAWSLLRPRQWRKNRVCDCIDAWKYGCQGICSWEERLSMLIYALYSLWELFTKTKNTEMRPLICKTPQNVPVWRSALLLTKGVILPLLRNRGAFAMTRKYFDFIRQPKQLFFYPPHQCPHTAAGKIGPTDRTLK